MGRRLIAGTLGCAALAVAAPALAQSAASAQSNFKRDRNVSVQERPRPAYQAQGIRAGAFLVLPRVDIGGEYDDNIFASEVAKEDDFIGVLSPSITARSTWSRNGMTLFARGTHRQFVENDDESTTDAQGGGSGFLEFGNSRLDIGGDFGVFTEPRTSTTTVRTSDEPIRFTQLNANAGLTHEFNRLRLQGRFDYRRFNYKSAEDGLGNPVPQDDRDRGMLFLTGRADYALSPDTSIYVTGVLNRRDYRLDPPNVTISRDSEGYDIAVGASFDLSNLARGEIQVGYLEQDYEAPGVSNASGLSARAIVEWFPTQLTTVTFSGGRTLEEAGTAESSSFLSTTAGVAIDHELLRNLILSARASYTADDYQESPRNDERFAAGVSALYLLNPNFGVKIGYDYLDQTSDVATGPEFKVNRVFVTATIQL